MKSIPATVAALLGAEGVIGAATMPQNQCVGVVFYPTGESGILDCRVPCTQVCGAFEAVVGPITYCYCGCASGGEPPPPTCCYIGYDVEHDVPVAAGSCSAQNSSCPTGNFCDGEETQLEDGDLVTAKCKTQ
jgi:hypothetical protein